MTAHERLRQLHANATPGPWEPYDNGHYNGDRVAEIIAPNNAPAAIQYPEGSFAFVDADIIATLRNALPQLANLALTAETLLRYYAGRDEPILDSLRDALADLEQALNPTRNTQSPT